MPLKAVPKPSPNTPSEAERTYYAALWGNDGGAVRKFEMWRRVRDASVKLALLGAVILLAYAVLSGGFAGEGSATIGQTPAATTTVP